LSTQQAYHENNGKVYLRTSGRTGVVLLCERAHTVLYWLQVWPADRLCLVAKQIEIKKKCDEVPFDCSFLSAWGNQQKVKKSIIIQRGCLYTKFHYFWRVYNHKLQNAPLYFAVFVCLCVRL
jgi:hypothetical protein